MDRAYLPNKCSFVEIFLWIPQIGNNNQSINYPSSIFLDLAKPLINMYKYNYNS